VTEKAAVIGASGYVGRYLLSALGPRGIGTGHARADNLIPFDIAADPVQRLVDAAGGRLSHVFLAGGATNPERCARAPGATRIINVANTIRVMKEAMDKGATPVFLSTDYVFRGDAGGYREAGTPDPTTEYGRQKAEVEAWMKDSDQSWIIARLSKVVGLELDAQSVIGQWAAEMNAGKPTRSADDQIFSPAWAQDIGRALAALADGGQTGVWHVAGPAPVSRYDLARLLVDEIARVNPSARIDLSPCKLNDIGFAETRPLKTWLNTEKLQAFLPWKFRTMQDLCAEAARRYFT
jgi:dTDP-4-dehydrorhamnose reductase